MSAGTKFGQSSRSFLQEVLDVIRPTLTGNLSSARSSGTGTPRMYQAGSSGSQPTEELLVTIFIALLSGQRAMLVSIKPEVTRELRRTLEQLLSYIFNFSVTHVQVDRPDRPLSHVEFLSSLLYRGRGDINGGTGTPMSSTSRKLAQPGHLSRGTSEDDRDVMKSLSGSHMRQTSLRSDTSEPLETSVHSSMHSSIGVPYRSARSHTRAAATAGSRPMLFPLMTGGGDTTPPESHTSLGGPKQLPNVVIVEGIDAASRSVYSALHEVIERGQVTDRNSVFPCPNPFLIIGITSPSAREQAIPQQLLDKFFLCHTLAAPPYRCIVTYPLKVPLLRFDDFERMTQSASFVYMHADVHSYLRDLITALRNHPSVGAGVSPKCGTDLMYAARLLALISGNQSITPDHVIAMTDKVLGHRLTPAHHSIYVPLDVRQRFKGLSGLDIIGDVLNTIPVPI